VFPELDLIVAPRDTYAALARVPGRASMLTALRRPLLVAVVLGVSVAIAATRRVSPALVISTTLAWSYVVVLQLAIALPLVSRGARHTVGLARAVDLFFAAHAPWSMFALAAAAWGPSQGGRPLWPLALAAVAPITLTPRIVVAFFTEVLAMDRRGALRMTVAHQTITWMTFVAVNWIASSLTPRVYEILFRW
jgi:hypothetical protein